MPDEKRTAVPLPPADDPLFRGACRVVAELKRDGHEAWIVGGAVRDLMMGLTPHEYDVTTSATPDQVMKRFRKTIPVGLAFGVVRVRLSNQEYEVATLRADVGHTDGRRPDSVRFTDLREDVTRRDFTMNGLVMDPGTGEVVDLVGGMGDIAGRRIRAIGDPRSRFEEDRLRPLRAVRFAAQTGFELDAGTYDAVRECAPEMRAVSAERIQEELRKLLGAAGPGRGLRLLRDSGILAVVLPDLASAGPEIDTTAATLDRLVGTSLETRWAALLWPLGAAGADAALGRLKHSNHMRQRVTAAIEEAREMAGLPLDDPAAEKRLLRAEGAVEGLAVLEARVAITGADPACVFHARARLAGWGPLDLNPERLLTGNDVMAAGVPRGPAVAEALRVLEDAQLRGEVATRDEALALLRTLIRG